MTDAERTDKVLRECAALAVEDLGLDQSGRIAAEIRDGAEFTFQGVAELLGVSGVKLLARFAVEVQIITNGQCVPKEHVQ